MRNAIVKTGPSVRRCVKIYTVGPTDDKFDPSGSHGSVLRNCARWTPRPRSLTEWIPGFRVRGIPTADTATQSDMAGPIAPRKPCETARWVRVPPRRVQHGDRRHLIKRDSITWRAQVPSDHTERLRGPPNQQGMVGTAHLLMLMPIRHTVAS